MTKAIVWAVCMLGCAAAFGQSPLNFRSVESVGLSSGSSCNCGLIETVNGVSRGPWFAGLGAGVDYYRFRSVPLFLSVTRDIAIGKENWFFLYLDGGTNLPWYKRPPGALITPESGFNSVFHSGEYWSGGVGYLWKLGDHSKKAVLFSAGYMVKKLREDQTAAANCPLLGGCPTAPPSTAIFEYLCRAYQFMIGFRF